MKLDLNAMADTMDDAAKYAPHIDDDEFDGIKSAMLRYSDYSIRLGDYGILFLAMLNSVGDKDGFMDEAMVCLHGFERKDAR